MSDQSVLPFGPAEGMERYEFPAEIVPELLILNTKTGETFCAHNGKLLHGDGVNYPANLEQLRLQIATRKAYIGESPGWTAQYELEHVLFLIDRMQERLHNDKVSAYEPTEK